MTSAITPTAAIRSHAFDAYASYRFAVRNGGDGQAWGAYVNGLRDIADTLGDHATSDLCGVIVAAIAGQHTDGDRFHVTLVAREDGELYGDLGILTWDRVLSTIIPANASDTTMVRARVHALDHALSDVRDHIARRSTVPQDAPRP
jgi:hypothetical protein